MSGTTVSEANTRVMEVGHAPTPYSADEIRLGCPTGRSIKLLVETAVEPTYIQHIRFVESDEVGATQDLWRTSPDGEPRGGTDTVYSTWEELQKHASFEAGATSIDDERIEIPAGVFDCVRYTVARGVFTHVFWFANDLPGMPVKFTAHTDDRLTYMSEMIANTIPKHEPERN